MYRKILIFFSVFLLSFASNGQTRKTINLDEAIKIALESNISVQQSRNSVEAQKSAKLPAIGSLLPSLNASGGFQRTQNWRPATGATQQYIPNYGVIEIPGSSGYSGTNSYNGSLSSSITLFNGFANIANINRTEANLKSAEFTFNRTKETIIFQTHQLFLNVVRTFQLLNVNEENLKRSRRQLERIEETNRVGLASLADVYRQRVATGNDELSLINSQNNYEKAKTDLLIFLSIDDLNEYDFDISSVPISIDTTELNLLKEQYKIFDKLVKQAMQNRSDYFAAVQNQNSAKNNITIARAGVYPSLYGNASYGVNNKEFSKIRDNKTFNLGLSVSLPIFSGFQTKNAIEQAKIAQMNSELQLNQIKRQIVADIQKALLDLEAIEKQLKVTQASVYSAEMDRKIAEEKYNLGAGTLLDLLIANTNFINAQSNNVNAIIGYLLAKKQMDFVLGNIAN